MLEALRHLKSDEDGQDLIEYGLITGFISLLCYVAIKATGQSVSDLWSNVVSKAADAAARM